MKISFQAIWLIAVALFSCSDNSVDPRLASVSVVNVALNVGTVNVNYFGENINWGTYSSASVNYGSSRLFSLPAGNNVPLVIVPASDTLNTLFNDKLNLRPGEIYTLYLTGEDTNVESVMIHETAIPKLNYPDSSFNVRFINLSPNTNTVSVSIAGSSSKEFTNVAFKQITQYKTLDAPKGLSTISFQIRDSNTDALLASYNQFIDFQAPSGARFHSITLVLRGKINGSPGPAITSVNNY